VKFEGIYTPAVTPLDQTGQIDRAGFAAVLESLIEAGVHGIIVGGSTGEYYAQSSQERFELAAYAREVIGTRLPLIIGTGATRTEDSVEYAKAAKEIGADAILVSSPPYALPTERENAVHALTVDRAANLPIMLYNYPARMGVMMGEEYFSRLGKSRNVIAIKESSGNLEKVMQLIREVKHGFQVLVGSAPTLWPSLLMGATGAILAYANAAPYSTIAIWEAYRTREEAAGLDWQNRIARASSLVTVKYGIPGLKHAMDLNGYYGGPPRLPLTVPTPEAKREIEAAFQDLKG